MLELLAMMCMCPYPCDPGSPDEFPRHACIPAYRECPCTTTTQHAPKGCHSHSTHYNITYTDADLRWNKTRTDIRNWLKWAK
jgi:hypothetical protein